MISDKFEYTLGTPNSGFSMFLAERTKKVHFIRHAEGHHNVATIASCGDHSVLLRGDAPAREHEYYDARLTEIGIAQAKKLKTHLSQRPSQGRPFTTFDLVVVSPLTRTLETARHIFGRGRSPGKPAFLDEGSEMNIDEGIYGHIAAPRMLVREECRERFGHYVCDGRRPIRELYDEFGDFDFSEVQYDEDSFYTDERESDQACCDRALAFLEWLNKRPEKCIAVVTHSSFLRHLFGQFGGNLERGDADNLRKLAGNCELRSVVMCSHGSKERGTIKPMIAPPSASPSDYHT
ncbi:histidine phosphatase superfamily [Pelagophyceae sp. CCMP2097]|nr:histidine phosphatase superfamily [Pelagophyceae sp. CCMP2097]|mmetsp:Transcript_6727/g.21702  ORF Transcript_6727/g.21702 Transcript_6727/m.21702 type:complete len:292 (+) Transcript_6727:66-941(+)